MKRLISLIRNKNIGCVIVSHNRRSSTFPVLKDVQTSVPLNQRCRNFCSITVNGSCWNCKETSDTGNLYFCSKCGHLQDARKDMDYFDLLELSDKYTINATELTTKLRELQSFLHPDKYSKKSSHEQTNSLEWSSLINEAYKTLSIPIRRAEYLLQLQGISIPGENTALNAELLMEIMEKNEDVDNAETTEDLEDLLKDIKFTLTELYSDFGITLKDGDLEKGTSIFIKMKYFTSIEISIKTKLYNFKEKK